MLPFVSTGTLLVQGQGVARVTATGARTEMGKIGTVCRPWNGRDTAEDRIDRSVRTIAIVGNRALFIIVIVYGMTRFNWIEGFLAGITLAMAILPEEFPVVLTVFLALWGHGGYPGKRAHAPDPRYRDVGICNRALRDKTAP